MATYREAKCRLCRREGEKLFLKGSRCFTEKCAFERRGYAPGEHGKDRRPKETQYGVQLRMKQKTRRIYGVLEAQFRNYFAKAEHQKGVTGQNLLLALERRLDNLVFRLGFAPNRETARVLVTHGHFTVNETRTDIPSMLVKPGDVVKVREGSLKTTYFKGLPDEAEPRNVPVWLERNTRGLSGKVLRLPERAEIDGNLNEQLIVEYYSR